VSEREYGVRRSLRKGRPSMEMVKARVATIIQPNKMNRAFNQPTREFAIVFPRVAEGTMKLK
jgi:hypothetical protein